ncbi:unnamed protein product, partial [Prorocentrum cordatum]
MWVRGAVCLATLVSTVLSVADETPPSQPLGRESGPMDEETPVLMPGSISQDPQTAVAAARGQGQQAAPAVDQAQSAAPRAGGRASGLRPPYKPPPGLRTSGSRGRRPGAANATEAIVAERRRQMGMPAPPVKPPPPTLKAAQTAGPAGAPPEAIVAYVQDRTPVVNQAYMDALAHGARAPAGVNWNGGAAGDDRQSAAAAARRAADSAERAIELLEAQGVVPGAANLNAVNHAEQLLQTVSVQLQQLPHGRENLGQMRDALNRVYEQVSILQAQPNSSAEAYQQVLQGVTQIRRMLEGTLEPRGDAIDQVGQDVVNLAAQVTNLEGQVNQVGQLVMTTAMQVAGLCRQWDK